MSQDPYMEGSGARPASFATSHPEGSHDAVLLQRLWRDVREPVRGYLEPDDDQGFWRTAVPWLLADAACEARCYKGKEAVLAEIGACSRWLRPHQSRVTLAGGFAAPFGYGNRGQGYAPRSLPELDGSLLFSLDRETGDWLRASGRPGRRPLVLRAALPARTQRHAQASIHCRWQPGSPTSPKEKVDHLYFFRRCEGEWRLEGEMRYDRC